MMPVLRKIISDGNVAETAGFVFTAFSGIQHYTVSLQRGGYADCRTLQRYNQHVPV